MNKPASIKLNVAANYVAQLWTTLMGLAFVPFYIRYLGIEVYGLMGVFALLQALLPLLDMGMASSLSREMSKFRAGAKDLISIKDLLRTIEWLFGSVALVIGAMIWGTSLWIASDWLNIGHLPVSDVAQAISIMGLVVALRFFESIYRGSLMGLQRQVLMSGFSAVTATVRGAGAAFVLAEISPTLTAFFVWQAIVSILSTAASVMVLYRSLPHSRRRGEFSIETLKQIRSFAGGMAGISVLGLILTQIDKLLLSRLLPLREFGYYMLAANVATLLYAIGTPITQAYLPRFVELHARGDEPGLNAAFHKSAQLVTAVVGSFALMMIGFGEEALHFWTHDPEVAREAAPLLAVLALGMFLNCLLWMPYQLQIAHGLVGLALKTNIVAVICVIPGIWVGISRFGPIGAAGVWVLVNATCLAITPTLMFRKMATNERSSWYRSDLIAPLLLPTSFCVLLRWLMPTGASRFTEFGLLCGTTVIFLAAGSLSASTLRHAIGSALSARARRIGARLRA